MTDNSETLKADGKFEEAGRVARAAGQPRYYGCHYGMKSTLERDREAFYRGWDAEDLAFRTGSDNPPMARRLTFKLVKAEDFSVDDQYEVYLDGQKTALAIQITFGLYSVNEEVREPKYGVIFYDGEFRNLAQAKELVAEILTKKGL